MICPINSNLNNQLLTLKHFNHEKDLFVIAGFVSIGSILL